MGIEGDGFSPGHGRDRLSPGGEYGGEACRSARRSSWSAAGTPPSMRRRASVRMGAKVVSALPPGPRGDARLAGGGRGGRRGRGAHRVHGRAGRGSARGRVVCIRMAAGPPDASGRPRPVPIEGSEFALSCDAVIMAVGQTADAGALKLEANADGTARVGAALATPTPGDLCRRGCGFWGRRRSSTPSPRAGRASVSIDRYLGGEGRIDADGRPGGRGGAAGDETPGGAPAAAGTGPAEGPDQGVRARRIRLRRGDGRPARPSGAWRATSGSTRWR